jgi:RNA polymerase sigma-70 factor, ECF subfamily
MSDGDDDRTLLARHAAGDRGAFAELVSRHRDRLWRVALRTVGDPDDAADALQDALVSAYRAAGNFRGDAAVTTWLHRIVVNAALDVGRRRGKHDAVPLSALSNVPVDAAASGAYDDSDTASAVIGGLRQLPQEQAAAVVLVDIEGFSVHDAAEILDVPEGTVKSRCARARSRLAEILADLAPGNPADRNPADRNPGDPPPVQRYDAPTPPTDDGDTTP